LIFGSGAASNLNTDVHHPVVIDNSGVGKLIRLNLKEFSITILFRM
jgi:hypothetical protein